MYPKYCIVLLPKIYTNYKKKIYDGYKIGWKRKESKHTSHILLGLNTVRLLDVRFKVTLWLSYRVCKLWVMPFCRSHVDMIRSLLISLSSLNWYNQSINLIDRSINRSIKIKDPSQARLCYCFDLKFAIRLLVERDKTSTVQLVKI